MIVKVNLNAQYAYLFYSQLTIKKR